jgi:hypothetical protein
MPAALSRRTWCCSTPAVDRKARFALQVPEASPAADEGGLHVPHAGPVSEDAVSYDTPTSAAGPVKAIANRTPAGNLPSGKAIAECFGRRERWGRLVKQTGITGGFVGAAGCRSSG